MFKLFKKLNPVKYFGEVDILELCSAIHLVHNLDEPKIFVGKNEIFSIEYTSYADFFFRYKIKIWRGDWQPVFNGEAEFYQVERFNRGAWIEDLNRIGTECANQYAAKMNKYFEDLDA
jgi:hypothetical protein